MRISIEKRMFKNGIARRRSTQLWAWHSRTGAQTPLGLQPWLTPLLLLPQAFLLCLLLHHPLHWTTLRSWKKQKQNTSWLKIHLLHSSHRSLLLPSLVWFWRKDKREEDSMVQIPTQKKKKKKKARIYWTAKKNLGEYKYIRARIHTHGE